MCHGFSFMRLWMVCKEGIPISTLYLFLYHSEKEWIVITYSQSHNATHVNTGTHKYICSGNSKTVTSVNSKLSLHFDYHHSRARVVSMYFWKSLTDVEYHSCYMYTTYSVRWHPLFEIFIVGKSMCNLVEDVVSHTNCFDFSLMCSINDENFYIKRPYLNERWIATTWLFYLNDNHFSDFGKFVGIVV